MNTKGNYSTLPSFMIEGALKKIVQTGDKKSSSIAREILEGPESDYDLTRLNTPSIVRT